MKKKHQQPTAANNDTNFFWLYGKLLAPDETNYSETNFGDASKSIYQTASSTLCYSSWSESGPYSSSVHWGFSQ